MKSFISTSLYLITKQVTKFLQNGNFKKAFSLFNHLYSSSSYFSTPILLPSLIKATSSLTNSPLVGPHLHCLSIKTSLISDVVISNSLISMYSNFSNPHYARQLFDEMPLRDSVSWNSIINSYIRNGCSLLAITMFNLMYRSGYSPKPELTASLLSVCTREGLTSLGTVIHTYVVVTGMINDSIFIPTCVVDFYMKCGDMGSAFRVFDKMGVRNEVSWTAIIKGCAVNGSHRLAVDCFRRMQVEGVKPNRVTLLSVLPASSELGGKELHGYAFRHGFESEPCFSAALIHMYCQFRGPSSFKTAQTIMERSTKKDVVMWTCIIGSYARNGDIVQATKHFIQMQHEAISPNSVTLITLISACTNHVFPCFGQAIHSYALKSGLLYNTTLGNSLISMYAKCGCLAESKLIFNEMPVKDSVSWGTLIDAHGISGYGKEALQMLDDMKQRGVYADSITLLSALAACNYGGLVEEGQVLFHEMIKDKNIEVNVKHYACQIDLLARAGKIEEACEVIRKMPFSPSVKIWSSLVSACIHYGRLNTAEMLGRELIDLEPHNAANYTLLAMVYAKSDQWHAVEALWRLMRAKGLKKKIGFSKAPYASF